MQDVTKQNNLTSLRKSNTNGNKKRKIGIKFAL